jgi:hypothetical protein
MPSKNGGTLVRTVIAVFLAAVFFASAASAQQASSIAGLVTDESAAVLPGVTVEATSPALIEKVRTVVTDSDGRYNIIDLRPGTYTVTFTLPGFRTFRREGIVLTAGFAATVDGQLQLGSLEETITVTGEAPLVDTQSARRQTVVSDELLDVLPTSTKNWSTLATLTPGMSSGRMPDVAGQLDQTVGRSFHGRTGTRVEIDGMGVMNWQGNGGNEGYIIHSAGVEEMVVQTSGASAESKAAGALVNLIPREGGNEMKGSLFGLWTGESLGTSNLTPELEERGLTTESKILEIYDATATLGGAILSDRLWFYTAHREWGNRHQMAGVFWNATQGTPFWTPDPDRPADRYQWYESHLGRVTWQASRRNKVNFFVDYQNTCQCRSSGAIGTAPEVGTAFHFRPNALIQGSWTSPRTNKLLLEAGVSEALSHWPQYLAPGVEPHHISILEQSTGIRYNAPATFLPIREHVRISERFSVSYVTGSHAVKVGIQAEQGIRDALTTVAGDVNYRFNRGIPNEITQYATPYLTKERVRDLGMYAQDQWTLRQLTINAGVRFDYFHGYVPPQDVPAGQFGPARSFEAVKHVPLWKDISPRVGAAYNLFGNGRTALKASMGRYVGRTTADIAAANNPIATSVNTTTRAWNDVNGNYVPDCDLRNFAANGECAAIENSNFGQTRITTRYSDDAMVGWGRRDYHWDTSLEIQHQIGSSVSVSAGYYRNWYGNFLVTDNFAVSPADFAPYSIAAPADPRLPGGGGYTVDTLYNISPQKFGAVDNLVVPASEFGDQSQVSDFMNATFNARLPRGAQMGGGIDTGRTVRDRCFVVDSPQELLHCRVVTPFAAETDIKLHGSYPMPAGFVVSAVYQNMSGIPIEASYAATTAEVAATLGRNLAGGARTVTVPLVAPNTMYEDRRTRIDLRLTKLLAVTSRIRVQANIDVYNVTNTSGIQQVTTVYGPRWLLPQNLVEPRVVQFSGRLTF